MAGSGPGGQALVGSGDAAAIPIRYADGVVIVLTGAAGAGTTTIGRALAAELGWTFVDGGRAQELHAVAARALDHRAHTVIASPALTRHDREVLRGDLRTVRFVYFQPSGAASERRVERPSADEALTVDSTWTPERILGAIRTEFGV